MNRKLKRTALIINEHIGMISEGLCDTEDCRKRLMKILICITEINYIKIYIYTVYIYIYIERQCVCVCVYIYIYIYIHTNTHTHTHYINVIYISK